jgi:hypothetical protein
VWWWFEPTDVGYRVGVLGRWGLRIVGACLGSFTLLLAVLGLDDQSLGGIPSVAAYGACAALAWRHSRLRVDIRREGLLIVNPLWTYRVSHQDFLGFTRRASRILFPRVPYATRREGHAIRIALFVAGPMVAGDDSRVDDAIASLSDRVETCRLAAGLEPGSL